MSTILEMLERLRAQRRRSLRALGGLNDEQLTTHVGPERPANVRHTLLSLAQDDDRRRCTVGTILTSLGWTPSDASRILQSLALTRGYLRAILVGVTDELLDQQPASEEWAVRQALQHVMNNERRFVADAGYAVERLRSADPLPMEPPGEPPGPGALGLPVPGGLQDVLAELERVRDGVITCAAGFGPEELAAPMVWAGSAVNVGFMLHRRATHEREHTVQIAKILRAIGCRQSEVQMILGQAEIARAALEGAALGFPDELADGGPSDGLPSLARLLADAGAEEESKTAAILRAVGRRASGGLPEGTPRGGSRLEAWAEK